VPNLQTSFQSVGASSPLSTVESCPMGPSVFRRFSISPGLITPIYGTSRCPCPCVRKFFNQSGRQRPSLPAAAHAGQSPSKFQSLRASSPMLTAKLPGSGFFQRQFQSIGALQPLCCARQVLVGEAVLADISIIRSLTALSAIGDLQLAFQSVGS
jgi:hypothetical protein